MEITGHIVDVFNNTITAGHLTIRGGLIAGIEKIDRVEDQYIMPGFVDAHVHIESSMLIPSEFARMAVTHGTVATVSDPHEIANVLGADGVDFMIRNGADVPFKFYFGAPSCVPATSFESAGARLAVSDVAALLDRKEIRYLAEMMNWPGVLNGDEEVYGKIRAAAQRNKVVDGHAPGLLGKDAAAYAAAGISTDHECFTAEEALDKLRCGMKIIVREGSAARNFDALAGLLHDHADRMMFCSDDKHPDSLEEGHVDQLVRRAVAMGVDVFKVLRAACTNPVLHYGLDVGLLRRGDAADLIVVNNLREFRVLQTYVNGQLVAENGRTLVPSASVEVVNNFHRKALTSDQLLVRATSSRIRVITARDAQLVTGETIVQARIENGYAISDPNNDVLKLCVVNRYNNHAPPAVGFIRNFNLKEGAIASTVAHDSHNIIAVGVEDDAIVRAINLLIGSRGGISAVGKGSEMLLPLPIAGLMSADDGYRVAKQYKAIDLFAKKMGSTLSAPFMTLSFMALLVIPSLKLSDKGLFDGSRFEFCDLFV